MSDKVKLEIEKHDRDEYVAGLLALKMFFPQAFDRTQLQKLLDALKNAG